MPYVSISWVIFLNLSVADMMLSSAFSVKAEFFFLCIFYPGRWQPTQSQLIQIYSVDWTDIYDTHNIEHRTEPVSH